MTALRRANDALPEELRLEPLDAALSRELILLAHVDVDAALSPPASSAGPNQLSSGIQSSPAIHGK